MEQITNSRQVFVVHGRNWIARQAMFDLLTALRLDPVEWDTAIAQTGQGAPYVGDVLQALKLSQAVVVLLTGDDESRLRPQFLNERDGIDERQLTPQPRPNVLFETGIAFGCLPERTILVQIGLSRNFSDVTGRHIIHFDDTPESRHRLASRLSTAGCPCVTTGTEWLKAGNFIGALALTNNGLAGHASKPSIVSDLSSSIRRKRIVDQMGGSDYKSINDAIMDANQGDEIYIRQGIYKEAISIQISLELVGEGQEGDVVIESDGTDAVLFNAFQGRLHNLTFIQANRRSRCQSINHIQGRLEIDKCDVRNESMYMPCINISGRAIGVVRECRIHDSNNTGLYVSENSTCLIEGSHIFNNQNAGIEITDGSNATLRKNRVFNGRHIGIYVHGNSQAVIDNNDVYSNAFAGIEVHDGSSAIVRHNRIYDGKHIGVYIRENSRGTIEYNEIYANSLANIEIKSGSSPTIHLNRIHDGKHLGMFIRQSSHAIVTENDAYGNHLSGIEVDDSSNPTLRKNTIRDGTDAGILIQEHSKPVVENNTITNNRLCGIEVTTHSHPILRNNIVKTNSYRGLYIHTHAGAIVERNTFSNNIGKALLIDKGSEAYVTDVENITL